MTAPLAASTASRNKLKAFEFNGNTGLGHSETNDTEKENVIVRKPPHKDTLQAASQKSSSKHSYSSATATRKKEHGEALGYPQTPVGRVPLQELINNDGTLLEAIPNISPIEQVVWNGSPESSNRIDSDITPALRRGRRKRQPSDASSSQPQASNNFVTKRGRQPVEGNVQSLLRTPQADPVKELWNRYSVDGPERTPITSAAVARFLNSSSPRCNDSERGLQRSLTCGSGWPISATKRRKIDKTLTQVNLNYSQDFKDVLKRKDEAARCRDTLIQKINQAFAIPPARSRDETIISSSPTVSNEDPNHHLQDSPLDRMNTGLCEPSSPIRINGPPLDDGLVQSFSQTDVSALQQESAKNPDCENEGTKDSSFDYGGDEMVHDLLEDVTSEVNIPMAEEPLIRESAQLEPLNQAMDSRRVHHQPPQDTGQADKLSKPQHQDGINNAQGNEVACLLPKQGTKHNKFLQIDEDEYEFGDDGDFLDAELEAVVASYDVQSPPKDGPPDTGYGAIRERDETSYQTPKLAQDNSFQVSEEVTERITHDISSDDEFGADSDFEELANVFTQAAEQGEGASSDAVRTVHYGNSR